MLAADLNEDDNLDMSVANTTGFHARYENHGSGTEIWKADECRWPLRNLCGWLRWRRRSRPIAHKIRLAPPFGTRTMVAVQKLQLYKNMKKVENEFVRSYVWVGWKNLIFFLMKNKILTTEKKIEKKLTIESRENSSLVKTMKNHNSLLLLAVRNRS